MAPSKPAPARTKSQDSSPSHSPKALETTSRNNSSKNLKAPHVHHAHHASTAAKHHNRRKSGKDPRERDGERKTRPVLSRKSTGPIKGADEAEHDEERAQSGDMFPQYCMACEKQFIPANITILYCSESCRSHDHRSSPTFSSRSNSYAGLHSASAMSPPPSPFAPYFSDLHEPGPDIVPRASPTQARPKSYFGGYPAGASYNPTSTLQEQQPFGNAPTASQSSTALSSLRELAIHLPKTRQSPRVQAAPDSPPHSSSGLGGSISRSGSAVWNYIPFTIGAARNATTTPSDTPRNSWRENSSDQGDKEGLAMTTTVARHSHPHSNSHSHANPNNNGAGYSTAYGYGYTAAAGMDRPLPSRTGPAGYGAHRPRSMDLVTPFGL